jgi:hypothetical protein
MCRILDVLYSGKKRWNVAELFLVLQHLQNQFIVLYDIAKPWKVLCLKMLSFGGFGIEKMDQRIPITKSFLKGLVLCFFPSFTS